MSETQFRVLDEWQNLREETVTGSLAGQPPLAQVRIAEKTNPAAP